MAARVDAGFGASRTQLQRFAAENGSRLLETSALDGSGCPELIAAIAETIPWERLPRHTSPRLFQRIKAEILRLRDGGEALLTYKDLRQRLRQHFPSLDDVTLSLTERVLFAQLIQGQLIEAAESVQRRRHWLCPHCHAPKGNEAVLMDRLARDGDKAQVSCDACDQRFPLHDELELLLADPELRRQAAGLEIEAPQLTARRKCKLLVLEVGARITSTNQKWQEISPDEDDGLDPDGDDGLDVQLEFTDDDGIGTGFYLYLVLFRQLNAGPSHLRRRQDGREMFNIKKPRWIHTWTQQPYPVMLVIGREAAAERALFVDRARSRKFPDVRWMEISSLLRRELTAGRSPEQIKQIEFVGETLDMARMLH